MKGQTAKSKSLANSNRNNSAIAARQNHRDANSAQANKIDLNEFYIRDNDNFRVDAS